MISAQDITGLVLAGGRGSRMGGVDKGLQNFNGMPLALHTLMRMQLQVGQVMLNANRNLAAYEAFGAPVWPDVLDNFAGPLAGILTGMERCETPYLVPAPCDTPLFPLDLVQRLAQALEQSEADIAMAAALEPDATGTLQLQCQPVFCLMHIELLESLAAFTRDGGRKIDAWTAQHKTVVVPFNGPSDDGRAFANANTLTELHALEAP